MICSAVWTLESLDAFWFVLRNFKWPYMQRRQCPSPIHKGTLETLIWSTKGNYCRFYRFKRVFLKRSIEREREPIMGFYFFAITETLKPGDIPVTVWLSQKPGTVLGVYFSISETQSPGTVPELWHSSRSPGQYIWQSQFSLTFGPFTQKKTSEYENVYTSVEFKDNVCLCININVF